MKKIEISGAIPVGLPSFFKIDDDDYERVMQRNWYYHKFKDNRKHSIVHYNPHTTQTIGAYLLQLQTDHRRATSVGYKNGDISDCRKSNIILQQPGSQHQGIIYSKSKGVWIVHIYINRKRFSTGDFKTEEEAIKIKDACVYKLFKKEDLLIDKKNKKERLPERVQYRLQMFQSQMEQVC